jgi:hypothetical protein
MLTHDRFPEDRPTRRLSSQIHAAQVDTFHYSAAQVVQSRLLQLRASQVNSTQVHAAQVDTLHHSAAQVVQCRLLQIERTLELGASQVRTSQQKKNEDDGDAAGDGGKSRQGEEGEDNAPLPESEKESPSAATHARLGDDAAPVVLASAAAPGAPAQVST